MQKEDDPASWKGAKGLFSGAFAVNLPEYTKVILAILAMLGERPARLMPLEMNGWILKKTRSEHVAQKGPKNQL